MIGIIILMVIVALVFFYIIWKVSQHNRRIKNLKINEMVYFFVGEDRRRGKVVQIHDDDVDVYDIIADETFFRSKNDIYF